MVKKTAADPTPVTKNLAVLVEQALATYQCDGETIACSDPQGLVFLLQSMTDELARTRTENTLLRAKLAYVNAIIAGYNVPVAPTP